MNEKENVIVTYFGLSMHTDAVGDVWHKVSDKSSKVESERIYKDVEGGIDGLCKERPDLAFMVDYGQMRMTTGEGMAEGGKETPKAKAPVAPVISK